MVRNPHAVAIVCALALTSAGCGDPIVVLGDWPGVARIVAGVPDAFGPVNDTIATRAKLAGPTAVAAAPAGVAYVIDGGRILALQSSGRLDVLLTQGICPGGCLTSATGAALDTNGFLLIADPGANRIWRFDPRTKSFQALAGNGATTGAVADGTPALNAALRAPAGVAVGSDGLVYFSESGGNVVRRIDANGALSTVAGSGVAGFAGDGGAARLARLAQPGPLAVVGGKLYIGDVDNHRVRVVDLQAGTINTLAGTGVAATSGDGGPANIAALSNPTGLALNTAGTALLISDGFGNRVREVDLARGTIVTLVGTGATTYSGNGLSGGETALYAPGAVAVSPEDMLYIADTGHKVIWRLALRAF
jgi:hypothetical protein